MLKGDLAKLAEDIKQNGLIEDITMTTDGKLLDGNSRWDACELAGVQPRTVTYDGDDPIGFVISKNKHRKHLDKSVLAMTVAALVKLKPGDNQYIAKGEVPFAKRNHSSKVLAEQAGISVSAVEKARAILNHAAPNVVEMVKGGEVNLHIAAEAVRGTNTETQATWTKDDVKAVGRKAINSFPSNQVRKTVTKKSKKAEPPRFEPFRAPSAEETGFPVNGTMAEKDAHHKKYGRTPLHPKVVKDMLNHEASVAGYIQAILVITNETQPDALTFFASLEAMSQWVAQPEKGTDWGINFAGKAKKHRALLRERLPLLVKRVEELQAMVDGPSEVQA